MKAIIIGSSTTGKTSLAEYFRQNTSFNVLESDEELKKMNNEVYPVDDNYKMSVLVPKMVFNVLSHEEIIFFSGTHYFMPEDLQTARQKGFKIIQLFISKAEFEKRNKQRMENEGYEDHSKYFNDMLIYQKEIKDKGLVDKQIEASASVEEVAEVISSTLE